MTHYDFEYMVELLHELCEDFDIGEIITQDDINGVYERAILFCLLEIKKTKIERENIFGKVLERIENLERGK